MRHAQFVSPTRRFPLDGSSILLTPRQLLLICIGLSVLLATSERASGATPTPTTTSLTATQANVGTTAVTLVSQVSTASGSAVTAGTVVFCDTSAASCVGAPGAIATAQLVQTTTGSWTATVKVAVSVGGHSYKAVFQGTSLYQASSSTNQTINVVGKSYTFLANSLTPGSPGNYNWQGTLYGFGSLAPTGTLSLLDSTDGNLLLGSAALPSAFSPGFLLSNGSPTSTGTHPVSIAIADFNGDGFPDMAVLNASGVSILIGKHDGTFSATQASPIRVFGGAIAVGDFFNDGSQDIAVAGNGALTILQGDGSGNFGTWGSVAVGYGYGPYAVTVGDFNQDGKLDFAIANSSAGNVIVLLNKGDYSGFTSSFTSTFGSEPSSVATADFNGDGIPDLAVTDSLNNNVTILYGDGAGAFAIGPSLPTGTDPNQVSVADFNGDGRPDLIITNLGTYPYYGAPPTVLLGNGSGSFTPYPFSNSIYPASIAIADLNGDGIPDLVWASVGGGGFASGNGDGSFSNYLPSSWSVIQTSPDPFVAVSDFNGDGRIDTVSTNYVGNDVFVGLSEIGAQANPVSISVPSGGPQTVVASYDGDSNYNGSQSSPYLSACSSATAPTFSPAPGAYISTQFITLADSTPGATIYYTSNGVTPTSASATYQEPVFIPSTETLEAIGTAPGCPNSVVTTGTYTISIPTNQSGTALTYGTSPIGKYTEGTETFTFYTAGTLGSIAVLTQGVTGLDFGNAGTGTCTTGKSYPSGATCTVDISFTPKFPGTRYGGIVLKDNSGNIISSGYMMGNGSGPQLNFLPGAESVVASSGLFDPAGIAVDDSGNIYIVDSYNNRILKESPSGGGYVQSTVSTSNLQNPAGVAVDGAGNVYIADNSSTRVLKETPSASGYAESVVADRSSSFLPVSTPVGVAVNWYGVVYIAYPGDNQVLQMIPTPGGGYNQFPVIGSGLSSPRAVAVDGSGNVYIADFGNGRVLKETYSNNTSGPVYTQSVVANYASNAIEVDGNGNVYIADNINNRVLKEMPSAGGYVESIVANYWSEGIAVDENGNVYIADTINQRVLKEDFADPPSLGFAATKVGLTSSDSPQTITVENVGNAALSFPIPSAGKSPSISTNFTLNSSGTFACPLLTPTSSTPGTLAAGASCLLPISFTPSAATNLSGSLTLTDNGLNAIAPSYATQSITLSGTGIQALPSITWAAPAAIAYGTALSATQLDANSTVAGTFVYTPTAGTVLGTGTQTLSVAFTPTDATDYTAAKDTVQLTVNKGTPTVTVSPFASKIFTVQPLSVTVAVSGSNGSVTTTGSVTLTGGGYTSAAATLSTGSVTINIPAGSLAIGTDMLTANYTPDSASSLTYNVASGSNSVAVALLGTGTATVTATPSAATVTNQQTVNVAVSVAGSGSVTPSGIVTLSGGGYSAQQTLTNGAASFSIPAGALSSGADTLTAAYSGDGTYGIASGTTPVTVSPVVVNVASPTPVPPGGTVTTNAVLAAGSTYSGTMALTCSLTGTPSGAQSLPTCSLNPSSVTIAFGGGGTAVLTVKTTAATVGALVWPSRLNPWEVGGGGAVMAGLLMLGLPLRRRSKMSMLVLLMAIVASGTIGCTGGGGRNSSTSTAGVPATTAGSYIFTVTGIDSANSNITASTNVTITVQ